jgi:oxygen-dependent protoporphyrinogen oxidase
LLGGVYAGQARRLSFDAVSPALFARVRHGGSLLEHARRQTATTASGAVFAGLRGGVSTLVDALVADLDTRGCTLRSRTTVRELATRPGGGYRLLCGPVPAPEWVEADAVVLAAPAGPTGRLLSPLTDVAAELAGIPYASMAVLTLVLRGADLTGSGLLVPPGQLPTIKALTYSSNKWGWVGEQATAVWGPGSAVVRASVGRLGEERLLQLDDDALLARTWAEARGLPGWSGAELVTGHVTRWGGALPQYLLGHRDLVARLRGELDRRPGLAVCGAALDGVGVPACLASATTAVTKIRADLEAGDAAHPGSADTISRQLVERS